MNELSFQEVEYCKNIIDDPKLNAINRIQTLKNKVKQRIDGLISETESLFELRIASGISEKASNIEYEKVSVGPTSVDFNCEYGGKRYSIEIVSANASGLVRNCTETAVVAEGLAMTRVELGNEEIAREIIRIQGIITRKVFKDEREIKFKRPEADDVNIIVIDIRGFNLAAGDSHDCEEICCGQKNPVLMNSINGVPIKGIYDNENNHLEGYQHLRDKIHYLVFVKESFGSSVVKTFPSKESVVYVGRNPILCKDDASDKMPFAFTD